MSKYYVIGVGPGDPELITKKAEKIAYRMNVLAGGKRQLGLFPDFHGQKIEIRGELESFWKKLTQYPPPYGILASGDPCLYGILEFVKQKAELSEIEVIPGISSVQYLLAKEKKSLWHMEVISYHWKKRIGGEHFRFFLTPPIDIIEREDVIGENLSLNKEKIGKGLKPKGELYVVMRPQREIPLPGLPDETFVKRDSPMTKREVRVLIISGLQPKEKDVIWDIGAGTGAISCELARLSPSLEVYAIERKRERIDVIEENIKRLGLANVKIVKGDILDVMGELPHPDSVFIGGGGSKLEDIMEGVYERLSPGGRMVFSAITLDTAYRGYQFFKEKMKKHELFSVQIENGKDTGGLIMMIAQNRIFIGKGVKDGKME